MNQFFTTPKNQTRRIPELGRRLRVGAAAAWVLLYLLTVGVQLEPTFAAAWQEENPLNLLESTQTSNPNTGAQKPETQPPKRSTSKKKDEIVLPEPSNMTLDTTDGVNLKCTYLAAAKGKDSESGKTTIPFILLHDWDGNRADLLPFAQYLQRLGCAVIVPDLRGHGESTSVTNVPTPIDYKKFRKNEMATVIKDIERCKKFLVQRHNDGELNIDMLNVVAVGETGVLAVEWTLADWFAFPPMKGGIKQGQDVKSLTLISPRKRMAGININSGIKHPLFAGRTGPNLPTMVIWAANDETGAKEGSSIFETMKKGRPDVEAIKDSAEKAKATTLYHAIMPGTSANGTELIRDVPVQALWPYIAKFVATQVGAKRDEYAWQSRDKE